MQRPLRSLDVHQGIPYARSLQEDVLRSLRCHAAFVAVCLEMMLQGGVRVIRVSGRRAPRVQQVVAVCLSCSCIGSQSCLVEASARASLLLETGWCAPSWHASLCAHFHQPCRQWKVKLGSGSLPWHRQSFTGLPETRLLPFDLQLPTDGRILAPKTAIEHWQGWRLKILVQQFAAPP
mmetsp:Transcript_64881/g.154940  ORF Transcript_64881/g.154940 Transcript_64881/m.154940 type:complete len:178 (+) Transcript_64881:547-1080(+)